MESNNIVLVDLPDLHDSARNKYSGVWLQRLWHMSSHCKSHQTLEPNDLQQYCGPLSCVYVFPSHAGKPRRSSILTCIAGKIEEQGCWNKFSGNQRGGGFMKGKFVIHLKTAVCCWKPQPGGWRTIYSRIYSGALHITNNLRKKKKRKEQVCTTICLKLCSILYISKPVDLLSQSKAPETIILFCMFCHQRFHSCTLLKPNAASRRPRAHCCEATPQGQICALGSITQH